MEIRAKGLTKVFSEGNQRVSALDGVDLTLQSGEVVVLLGPSGSGKTTLLNLLSGLDIPTEGEVFLDGEPFSFLSDKEKSLLRNCSFGFVFQFFNLLPEFTVLENIFLPSLIGSRKENLGFLQEKAGGILTQLGLNERRDALPKELSAGEQQRVAIGRALINKPGFVFADEPTGNLDRENTERCLKIFHRIRDESKTGFIIATHNQEIAHSFATRTINLKNGKIVNI